MKHLISVIVPVYNVGRYIEKCILSVINQDYSDVELILVDDGSTDDGGKICDEYAKKDNRIKVIHKKNGGLSDARNVGIDSSSGDLLFFLDGDDYLPKNAIAKIHKCMSKTNADICEGEIRSIGLNDRNFKGKMSQQSTSSYGKMDALRELLYLNAFTNSACAKLYKRNVIGKIRFPKGKIYEDLATTYKFFLKANAVAKTGAIVYCYRQNEESIMHRDYSKERLTAIAFAKEQLDYYNSNYKELVPAATYRVGYECIRVLNDMPFFCKDSKDVYYLLSQCRKMVLKDRRLSLRKKMIFYFSYFGKCGIKIIYFLRRKGMLA